MADIAVATALSLLDFWFMRREVMNREEYVSDDIKAIESWLQTTRAILDDKEGNEENLILQDEVRQIRDIAFDMEDAIDEFMFSVPHHFHTHGLTDVTHNLYYSRTNKKACKQMSSKMKNVRKKIEDFTKINPLRTSNLNRGEPSSAKSLENHSTHRISVKDEMVGFEIPKEKILDQLLSGKPVHSLISVVGPPGSGKSTLVRNIYESRRVQGNFDHRAWIQVSPRLDLQKTLRSILLQFSEGKRIEEPYLQDTAAMLETLNRNFRHKSYVVVLDDIWRKQDCDSITNKLPTSSKCSRIIITSRISDVASSCQHRHDLPVLPWHIAWILFCARAFPTRNGSCPPELLEWAEKIVRKCEGLPFTVVTLGSLLSNKRQIPLEWKKVYDGLGKDLPIISSILIPSYRDLPSDLKRCFLYFSLFPEDDPIPCEKLICLWIAEGFVVQTRSRTLEETAGDNLNELIQRNLVQVCGRDIDGRARSCRLLNLVHEFIINKAEEEKFVGSVRNIHHSRETVRRLPVGSDRNASLKGEHLKNARSAFLSTRASCDCLHVSSY